MALYSLSSTIAQTLVSVPLSWVQEKEGGKPSEFFSMVCFQELTDYPALSPLQNQGSTFLLLVSFRLCFSGERDGELKFFGFS